MGVYEKHILPRLMHFAMDNRVIAAERARALEGVEGEVLELGIGSGLNLRHYGKNVRRVVGVDPSETAARLGRKEIAKAHFAVEIRNEPAESSAFDHAFDAVVSTFTLCTIPDVESALARAKRALKPGGRLFFLEHGLSNEPNVQRWQHRLEPLQKRFAGGCHLTRNARELIEAAGFAVDQVDSYYVRGPKPWSYVYRGVARAT
jgi:ubiquinone/menaquinone biosynthesis C-methylase UbiE